MDKRWSRSVGCLLVGAASFFAVVGCQQLLGDFTTELVVGSDSSEGGNPELEAGAQEEARAPAGDASVEAASDTGVEVSARTDASGDATSDTGADVAIDATADAGLPLAPRPLAPLSTSRVTSRSPTLRWQLPSGVSGATVDLCRDRACTMPIVPSITVTGTSYKPTINLPAGVVFWRLHPSTSTTVTSATWEFTVGAQSAPVDTSWGTTLDVNGDGFADVVVAAQQELNDTGTFFVFLGSAVGLSATPSAAPLGPAGSAEFGFPVMSAGDVNGDGYADVIAGAAQTSSRTGSVYLFLGGPTGLVATAAQILTGPAGAGGNFGQLLTSAGDLNGDGFADVVIGAPTASANGLLYAYFGSPTGFASAPAVTWSGPSPVVGQPGASLASAGDLNGDGYPDLAVGVSGTSSVPGSVYVYSGGPGGLTTTSVAVTLVGPDGPGGMFGFPVASAGDVDGDGFGDLIVGASAVSTNAGRAYVYRGSATGLATAPATSLTGSDGANGYFGYAVASAGDVNADGFGDVVVGAFGANSNTGRAYVYLGGAGGLSPMPATTLLGQDPMGYFGFSAASAGAVTGNGYSDVVVGAFTAQNSDGRCFVYLGGSSGLVPLAGTALDGPDGGHASFGYEVFGATN